MLNTWHLQRAVRALNAGGIVLHAAEGVWGLACDPFDEQAVARLLVLKVRRWQKGLIVIGEDPARFAPELDSLTTADRTRVLASWPGAVTWILPNRRFPDWITGGGAGVAVRVPGHPQARALCRAFDGALVSTSANRSGQPPATAALVARRKFPAAEYPLEQDYVLPGEVLAPGGPSAIHTLDRTLPRIR